jgi:hypothetical protein
MNFLATWVEGNGELAMARKRTVHRAINDESKKSCEAVSGIKREPDLARSPECPVIALASPLTCFCRSSDLPIVVLLTSGSTSPCHQSSDPYGASD